MDLTGNKLIGDVYFIDCYISGKRKIVLFQPTEKMVDALRKFNAKAVKKFDL